MLSDHSSEEKKQLLLRSLLLSDKYRHTDGIWEYAKHTYVMPEEGFCCTWSTEKTLTTVLSPPWAISLKGS